MVLQMTEYLGIKAVVISDLSGVPMVVVKNDENLNEILMSSFLAAVGSFSNEILGGTNNIFFQSGNLDLFCFFKKYQEIELKIFALMDSKMKKLDIKGEAEAGLDAFVEYYGENEIKNWNQDPSHFKEFENSLQNQIHEYYQKVKNDSLKSSEKKDNFLLKLLKRMKIKK